MRIAFRIAAAAGVCVVAVGLAGCGEDSATDAPPSEAAESTKATGANESDDTSDSGVAAFEGKWEYRPNVATSTTMLAFDAEGDISSKKNMTSPGWKGTITPADDDRYAVELESQGDDRKWSFTLAPTDDSDTWTTFDKDGDEDGTLVRVR